MQGGLRVASMFVVGLLGPGCQAHAVSPSTGESSSGDEDDKPGPAPSTVPTPQPGMTDATPTTTGTSDETSGTSDTGDASTTTTTTSTTTTGPSETCGDGLLDPGETCDTGFTGNIDGGLCTQTCQQAVCDDGLVWGSRAKTSRKRTSTGVPKAAATGRPSKLSAEWPSKRSVFSLACTTLRSAGRKTSSAPWACTQPGVCTGSASQLAMVTP